MICMDEGPMIRTGEGCGGFSAQRSVLTPLFSPQQSFEKQGFHTGTPAASFNLPSALGSGGPINPATAAAYPPTPFMHILTPHQQPHSQILHHHLQQDGQVSSPPDPRGSPYPSMGHL